MTVTIKTEKPILIADSESYPNFFSFGGREVAGERRLRTFELSNRSTIDWKKINKILRSYTVVGYNWQGYDILTLRWAVENPWCDAAAINDVSRRIIGERMKWWEAADRLGITIPHDWDFIDLMEPQPNARASLKALNARMHGRWMQELPYPFDEELDDDQKDHVTTYMVNDLDATEGLWHMLREPMALREAMGATVGADMRSKSDTQMGMAIVKHRVEKALKRRVYKRDANRSQSFKYDAPAYLSFETPILVDMMEQLQTHVFRTDPKTGKANLPDFLLRPVTIGETTYSMGIGGLHSTESNRCVLADADFAMVDADVGSYYPNIELSLGLYPENIGPLFIDVGRGIKGDRMAAKDGAKVANKEGRKDDAARLSATDKGLKIAMNGGMFGNLGSPYSIIYAPHLLLAVTITGQLALLMLIERAEQAGIPVVSANTDGVVFRCPRRWFAGVNGVRLRPSQLAEITDQWERDTQFELEFAEYTALYNRSVNDYIALKADGGHKRKGTLGNPWNTHPDDWNIFYGGQLMKNPAATICSDAVLNFLKDGVPIEDTIYGCEDVRQFVTVIKATAGATWRGDYLGKTIRYYWSTDGDPILEAAPNAGGNFKQVPKTDGARPLMTYEPAATGDLPWALPADIDYAKYISEARTTLRDIGYFGAPTKKVLIGRVGEVRWGRMLEWATTG